MYTKIKREKTKLTLYETQLKPNPIDHGSREQLILPEGSSLLSPSVNDESDVEGKTFDHIYESIETRSEYYCEPLRIRGLDSMKLLAKTGRHLWMISYRIWYRAQARVRISI